MRHPRFVVPLVVALLAVLAVVPAHATRLMVDVAKGKSLFRSNCRTCHGGLDPTPELHPNSKTMVQWNDSFGEDAVVSRDCLPRVKDKTGTKLTAQDLLSLRAYLVGHASDSRQPETCSDEPSEDEKPTDESKIQLSGRD